jgi:hypothetical protein
MLNPIIVMLSTFKLNVDYGEVHYYNYQNALLLS